jgi:hypothetical protein
MSQEEERARRARERSTPSFNERCRGRAEFCAELADLAVDDAGRLMLRALSRSYGALAVTLSYPDDSFRRSLH